LQADFLADEVIPIVNGERPILNKLNGVELPNLDSAVRVSRDMGRAKYFVWKAGRMSPRKWGEDVDGTDMGGIAPPIIIIRSSDDVVLLIDEITHQAGHSKSLQQETTVQL
jgi:hypothetical protein